MKTMLKEYQTPELEVISFVQTDIITYDPDVVTPEENLNEVSEPIDNIFEPDDFEGSPSGELGAE